MKRSLAPIRTSQSFLDKTRRFSMLKDRIVALPTWYSKQCTSNSPTPLVDLRSADKFATKRLSFENSILSLVPFPIEVLKERSFELPARHVEFAILLPLSDLERAEAFLLGAKDTARKRKRAQRPWLVTDVIIETPDFWNEARELKIDEHQKLTKELQHQKLTKKRYRSPLPRLWEPDAMIQNVLLPLLKDSLSQNDQVWDLASGAGRDVAFLAEELKFAETNFHKVVGLDHRYNRKETGIVTGFWKRRGVADKTLCAKMDLSNFDSVDEILSGRNVAAFFAVRFWKPSLVEALSNSTKIKSGTLFGMSHFCKPYDGAPWNFEHPTEKTVLERNQLKELFQEDWDILHDEIALDSDHGRSMIHFVARRR